MMLINISIQVKGWDSVKGEGNTDRSHFNFFLRELEILKVKNLLDPVASPAFRHWWGEKGRELKIG